MKNVFDRIGRCSHYYQDFYYIKNRNNVNYNKYSDRKQIQWGTFHINFNVIFLSRIVFTLSHFNKYVKRFLFSINKNTRTLHASF